jgi:hypothetical protein
MNNLYLTVSLIILAVLLAGFMITKRSGKVKIAVNSSGSELAVKTKELFGLLDD